MVLSKPASFRIEIVRCNGTVTLSPRFSFRSIAAHGAREICKEPGVISAIVVPARSDDHSPLSNPRHDLRPLRHHARSVGQGAGYNQVAQRGSAPVPAHHHSPRGVRPEPARRVGHRAE